MVGFGPLEQELRQYVAANHISNMVELQGRVQPCNIGRTMSEHDVLVLPSLREAYGLVVLEALTVGIPVIVSCQCGCVRDLVSDQNGWIVDATKVESFDGVWTEVDRCSPADWEARRKAAKVTAAQYTSARSVELTMAALGKWL